MKRWNIVIRLGLLYAMLLPILGLTITTPTIPHMLISILFLLLIGYMTHVGIKVYRQQQD